MTSLRTLFLLILLPACAAGQTYSKRLALVIGNANYQNGGQLKNPINDVRSMATALQGMGFEVMKYENATQVQIKQAINAYGQKLKGYEVGLFYYAGHGIQHKGINYMIPVEADLQAEEQIEFDCVAADRVLAYMESASTKINVIVMDACRNNPFERSWRRAVDGNGLALMNAPTGSLIAYATAPGKVASDGEASNGLYTSALLKYMKDPGLNIEQVFKRVRTEVSEKSMGSQVPWETTSLTGSDFYFTKSATQTTSITTTSAASTEVDYYAKGNEKYDQKDYMGAIPEYTKAIELNPTYVEAFLWRGHARYGAYLYKEAIGDYNKVIELSPGESQAYHYRGLSKYNLKQYSEAIPDFSLAIKYDPSYANGYYWRGNCYYSQQKYVAAIEDFNKTVELSPKFTDGYYMRGLSRYNLQEYTKGLEDFVQARTIEPDYAAALNWKANCEYMLKQYTDAVTDYTAYLKEQPTDAEAYYWRAYSYYNLNQPSQALKDVDKALELSPGNETYLSFKKDTLKK